MSSDESERSLVKTTWIGNSYSRQAITTILIDDPNPGTYFLVGPDGLGKRSFMKELLESDYPEDDYRVLDNTRDSLRETHQFFHENSLSGRPKVVVIADIEKANYAAQDSWLLTAEELPKECFLFFVISDEGALVEALRSRIRTRFNFRALDDLQMREFANQYGELDEFALSHSVGIPSIYLKMRQNDQYFLVNKAIKDGLAEKKRNLLIESLPVLCSEAKDDQETRRALSQLLRNSVFELIESVDRLRLSVVLQFAATIRRSASCDVELHWWRMASDILC